MRTPGRASASPLSSRKDPLELPENDLEHVRAGRERDARDSSVTSASISSAPRAPREAGAVVTVDHEVRLTELDRHDRREAAVRKRVLERAEPVSGGRQAAGESRG